MKARLYIMAGLLLFANFAMSYTITGIVTAKGEPMPGVVITRIGVNGFNSDTAYGVTDIDGNYSVDSGSGNPIMITASFVSYTSEMKVAEGSVVNFDLTETPYVPVKFFSSLLDQRKIVGFTMTQKFKGMGVPIDDFNIFLVDNTLVFSIDASNANALSEYPIKNFSDTTIKEYLKQLRAEGELNDFLDQLRSSGMIWGFGVYDTSKGKCLQYKEYNADQIRKLL